MKKIEEADVGDILHSEGLYGISWEPAGNTKQYFIFDVEGVGKGENLFHDHMDRYPSISQAMRAFEKLMKSLRR